MTLRELDRLFLKASKDIDARQRARIKQLRGMDKALFDELVRRIVEVIGTEEGKVSSGKGSVSINRMIDLAFGVVDRAQLSEFKRSALGDLSSLMKNGQDYFGASTSKKLNDVTARVNRTMRRMLGLDPVTGKPIEGGQFDRFFDNEPMRTEVKQVVSRGITAKIPMAKMLKQLQVTVTGTPESPGIYSKALGSTVLDLYQQVDAATANEYAKRLDLDTFIYTGGLIETSREFCIKRNGKIFTKEEAEKWKDDPTLPRSKKERETGVLIGYDPLVHRGRWGPCRHRLRYISRELAKELKGDEQKRITPEQAAENLKANRAARRSDQYESLDIEAISTIDRFTQKDGTLSEQRLKLHRQEVIDATAHVVPSEEPTLYMMGGGPASGKSSLEKFGSIEIPKNHVLADPDHFKKALPEYIEQSAAGDTGAAFYAHDESSLLNKKVMAAARKNSQDVLWDGTGDNTFEKLQANVQGFRDAGYKVEANYVTVPTKIAMDRNLARFQKTGRRVPDSTVLNTHRAVSDVLPRAIEKGIFDHVNLWDTTAGGAPVKVAEAFGSKLIVYRTDLWNQFLAKAYE